MRDRTPFQSLAMLVGVVFLLVGILGFVPGITTHYGDLSFAGHGSGAKLLGLFQVSILHNIVHLLFGVVGLVLAKTRRRRAHVPGRRRRRLPRAVGARPRRRRRLDPGQHRRQLAALRARRRDDRARVRRRVARRRAYRERRR